MKKKPKRSTQTGTADRLFSQLVRSKGICEAKSYKQVRCGGELQCCHVLSRRYRRIRWDFRNALAMCRNHHFWFTSRPEEWFFFLEETRPGLLAELRTELEEPWDRVIPIERLKS